MKSLRRHRGFTLTELLVAIALLGLLVSVASPVWHLNAKREKERELRRALWQIRDAVDAYKKATDQGLITKTADSSGYPPNLQILVSGVTIAQDANKRSRLRFLRRIPRDPFAQDESLSDEKTWKVHGFDGTLDDDAKDVFDVSSRSQAMGLNQQPYSDW